LFVAMAAVALVAAASLAGALWSVLHEERRLGGVLSSQPGQRTGLPITIERAVTDGTQVQAWSRRLDAARQWWARFRSDPDSKTPPGAGGIYVSWPTKLLTVVSDQESGEPLWVGRASARGTSPVVSRHSKSAALRRGPLSEGS
jgi:hypothetical protein